MVGLRKVWRRKGQSMVEFALVLPMLLTLILGIFDFGRLFFAYTEVANAAREGSRYGMVKPSWVTNADSADPENITYRAREKVFLLSRSSVAISVAYPDVTENMGDRITVTATVPFEMVTPIIGSIYQAVVPPSERQVQFASTRTLMPSEVSLPTPTATVPGPGPTSTTGPPTATPTTEPPTATPTTPPTATPTPELRLTVTFEPNYPAKQNGSNKPIFIKVKVVDQGGTPVDDATVTFTAESTNGTLTYIAASAGLYGDGTQCWSGGSFDSNVLVTVTANKTGYITGVVSATTTGKGGGGCP